MRFQKEEKRRQARGLNVVDHAAQDLRYAMRQLRKNPGFASTAIFGFVDAALIKPLPCRDQSRLVTVFHASPAALHPLILSKRYERIEMRAWRKKREKTDVRSRISALMSYSDASAWS